MIKYDKFTLDNGLRVLFHQDKSTPVACVNTLYDVGARDEDPNKTGFAHLFEHLMFGGSVNIPNFDEPLQRAGGENNAFTSNDITNYYDTLPKDNIETALWLESDRMLSLAFTPNSLEVQRSVVIEEFKQRYLNQPYGDVWLELRPIAYKEHPYQWATIGKEISHIEDATMEDVKAFFKKHYSPQNAILSITGDFELNQVQDLVQKWYGNIPAGNNYVRNLVQEPIQTEARSKVIEREVPADAFYYAFPMPARLDDRYYTVDLISDILGRGKSSRLYEKLVKETKLATEISCYVTGSIDAGMIMISGKSREKGTFEAIHDAIWSELTAFKANLMNEDELSKVKNKFETAKVFGDQSGLNKAMNLANFELLGDANQINQELEKYSQITMFDIQKVANELFGQEKETKLLVKAI